VTALAAAAVQQGPPPPAAAAPVIALPPPVVFVDAPPADQSADVPADVVVRARGGRGDPLGALNARSFDTVQGVDRALIGPVARAYAKGAPSPLRDGLRNFLFNLREPVVFANYLLQLKPGKAAETAGRFLVNTTAGVAGLFDVARRKPFRLPRRRNSFANTLGFYGVGPGPFFFLPLIGPTTLRDLLGNFADQFIVPVGPVRPLRSQAVAIPVGVLSSLDYRVQLDGALTCLRSAPDPYAATRAFYLARRRAEIDALRGRTPGPAFIPPGPNQAPSADAVAATLGCPASENATPVPPAARTR